ncbi:hypothetical protein [Parafilimonas terrae]|uniref:Glycosyl transferases group 1 n=1 Tax=Parafilimonas terrae TaxID=1465490 RepID=A0A1I5WFV5_9BACT|nr:hypothetical protein [Parafilimonas terrae]SFQ18612.1 hypothetical protein SAMN05444277_106161 [Parafilimonas terrae]
MRILIFTSKEEDYLQDSIIHGFKCLYGKEVIDFPAKVILYDDYHNLHSLRGNGFTLYGKLDKRLKASENINIEEAIVKNTFDLIIFSSIHRQFDFFYAHFRLLKEIKSKILILDGEDSSRFFPFMRKYAKFFFYPKPHSHFAYFKRELILKHSQLGFWNFFQNLFNSFFLGDNVKPISFSIPKEKIITILPFKEKLFTKHVVDIEISKSINSSTEKYAFNTEADYYDDIQQAKFGITTKRSGWDCLRHYEIAANGAVICFRDLNKKPPECAPHGLIDGINCINYNSYKQLKDVIGSISDAAYLRLQENSLKWVRDQTTEKRAVDLIHQAFNKILI